MKLKIIAIDHHRNGICGDPFDVVLFEDEGPEGSRKVAILFDEEYHCAVLDVIKLAAGNIAFASNSWRGDKYEPRLRKAIDQHLKARIGVSEGEELEAVLLKIAHDKLGVETLETRRSDRLDFHDVAVWCIKDALEAAFRAGVDHATRTTFNLNDQQGA